MSLDPKRIGRLVRHRERLEHLQEGELAGALRLQRERELALTSARTARESLLDARVPRAGALDPVLLASASACGVRFERDVESRRSAFALSHEDVEEERRALMECRRDRKAMESLLDRRLAEQRAREQRRSALRLDEIASNRWLARKTREGR